MPGEESLDSRWALVRVREALFRAAPIRVLSWGHGGKVGKLPEK